MKLRPIACAVALTLGAATTTFAAPQMLDISNGSATFRTTVADSLATLFSFTLTSESSVNAWVYADPTFRYGNTGVLQLTGPSGEFAFVGAMGDDGAPTWALATRLLAPGEYTVSVAGFGSRPEALTGNIVVDPVPVPEPATLGLLTLGLAGLGLQRVRRRR